MFAKSSTTSDHKHQIHYTPQRQKRKSPLEQSRPAENGLQWGSDPSFCYHGFSSPIGTWTEERLLRDLMRNMAFMWSGKNIEQHRGLSKYMSGKSLESWDQSSIRLNEESFLDFGKGQIEMRSISKSPSPTGSTDDTESESTAPPNKKRKCVQRPGQALCHCRSEKKRREAVAKGYQDLSRLVPGLESQNFTRKYILDEAAKYIETLLKGNDTLRDELAHIGDDENRITYLKTESS